MACCLTSLSYYLNEYWPEINGIRPNAIAQKIHRMCWPKLSIKANFEDVYAPARGQWVKVCCKLWYYLKIVQMKSKSVYWWPIYCCCISMMTSSHGNIFRITGPLLGIPPTKASDVEFWCFLWSAPEQTIGQTTETPVIWHDSVLIMTSQ